MSKRLIILGAPGVGKGTQAQKLKDQFGCLHISTGDMLRAAMNEGTELGQQVKGYVESGDLVPDDLIIGLVKERIDREGTDKGFLLDGFPRTVVQAEKLELLLDEMALALDGVVSIDVPNEEIVARLSKRYLCGQCGPVIVNSPGDKVVCPQCGGEVSRRKDDEPDTVRHRLSVYDERTKALIDFYDQRQLLKRIDGLGAVDDIFKRILKVL